MIDPSDRERFESCPLIDLETNAQQVAKYHWDFQANPDLLRKLHPGPAKWSPPGIDIVGNHIEIYQPQNATPYIRRGQAGFTSINP